MNTLTEIKALQPDLISKKELSLGCDLQVRFEVLKKHFVFCAPEGLAAAYRAARLKYLSKPTDENLEVLRRAAVEVNALTDDGRFRDVVRDEIKRFKKEEVVPWARLIVNRAKAIAVRELERITKEENERHVAATGRPARNSDIIDAARGPIKECADLLERLAEVGFDEPKMFVECFGFSL